MFPLNTTSKKKSMMVFNRFEAPIKTPKAALKTQNASMSEFMTGQHPQRNSFARRQILHEISHK